MKQLLSIIAVLCVAWASTVWAGPPPFPLPSSLTAASTAEVAAGTNETKFVNPKELKTVTDTKAPNLLTGYTSGAGTVAGTDTILQAIQKLNGNDGVKVTGPGTVTDGGVMCFNGTTGYLSKACTTINISTLNMPTSDADPSTTAGNVKHDSSSTEASTTNLGVVKWFDGTNVRTLIDTGSAYTLITKYEYLPIRYAEDDDSATAPAAAAEIGTTSMIARSFAEDADNGVVFFWQIPGDYVSGIKFRVFFATDTNAGANETAVFNLSGCAFGSSGAIACTEGTGAEATLELTTDEDTGELLVTGWSAAITIDGTPATGKVAKLLLIRDVTGGTAEDDMVGHALVTGIEIKYVGKINPFSDY